MKSTKRENVIQLPAGGERSSVALNELAMVLSSVDALDLAQSMAERAVAAARDEGDLEHEVLAGNVLGAILADRGFFQRARHQFRIAAAHYRNSGDAVRVKSATANLGHAYRKEGSAEERQGHPSEARLFWKQALRIYKLALSAARDDGEDAVILAAIGECECRLGSFEVALEDMSRAVELARQVGDRAVLAAGHLWQGHALKALNDLGAAELAYERACEAARTLDHDAILSTCLHELALLVQARGEALRAAQLEQRGRDALADRASFLARIRQELAPTWQGRIGAA